MDFVALLGSVSWLAFRQEDYSIHMNIPWTHDMSDEVIKSTLNGLVELGLLLKTKRSTMPQVQSQNQIEGREYSYSITESGGEEWSNERMPKWNSYCCDFSFYDENDHEILEFTCIDKIIGYTFAKTCHACKLYQFDLEHLKLVNVPSDSLIYWKKFKYIHSWRVPVDTKNKETIWPKDVDWELYEKNRIWWTTLKDLQALI